MHRPVVALGLIALAGLLLASAFADVQEVIDTPESFTPDERLLKNGADAFSDAPPEVQQGMLDAALEHADADLLRLMEDGSITLPEGTEVQDGMVRLGEDVQWTLPAGSELQDLQAPLAEGTGLVLPEGTWFADGAIMLPPGSTLRGADGGALALPDGGRIDMPGWSAEELQVLARDGTVTLPPDATLHAPVARTTDDWPLTLPAGARFAAPEAWQLPNGTLGADQTFTLPEGWTFDPDMVEASGDGADGDSMFGRLGEAFRNSAAPTPSEPGPADQKSGPSAPSVSLPGGLTWLYGILLLVTAAVVWWTWRRHGHRLRRTPAGAGPLEAAQAHVRIVHRVDDRPAGLPVALEPHAGATLAFHVEARKHTTEPWQRGAGRVVVRLDGKVLLRATASAQATLRVDLPPHDAGAHLLSFELTPGLLGRTERIEVPLHVAPWDQQVARDYQDLHDAAAAAVPALPDGVTPRMLRSALHHTVPTLDMPRLDDAILVFERANYSNDTVGAADWLRFATTTHAVRSALADRAEATPAATARRHADPAGAA